MKSTLHHTRTISHNTTYPYAIRSRKKSCININFEPSSGLVHFTFPSWFIISSVKNLGTQDWACCHWTNSRPAELSKTPTTWDLLFHTTLFLLFHSCQAIITIRQPLSAEQAKSMLLSQSANEFILVIIHPIAAWRQQSCTNWHLTRQCKIVSSQKDKLDTH